MSGAFLIEKIICTNPNYFLQNHLCFLKKYAIIVSIQISSDTPIKENDTNGKKKKPFTDEGGNY